MAKIVDTTFLRGVVQSLINKITGKSLEGNVTFDKVTFDNNSVITEDEDSVVISNGSNNVHIPVNAPDRTVATLEDETQEIHSDQLHVNTIVGTADENADRWFILPGDERTFNLPEGTEYGGTIMTTKHRFFDRRYYNGNNQSLIIQPYVYNDIITRNAGFTLVTDGLAVPYNFNAGGFARVYEYWIKLTIAAGIGDVRIAFSEDLIWATGQPVWSEYVGQTFLIHIVDNVAMTTNCTSTQDNDNTNYFEILGSGSLSKAREEARKDRDLLFQWILITLIDNEEVVKPIWHVGKGVFIDAVGYKLTDEFIDVADGTGTI